jgi:hypothetical protein
VSFSLTKWYLDVVTEAGAFAIAYWGEVRWGGLHLCFSAVQSGARGAAAPWQTSARDFAPPSRDGSAIRWIAAPLDVRIDGHGTIPSVTQELLATAQGRISWCAELPRAAMRVQLGDRVLEGLGYVERLELSMLPWRVPADTIRWGRFVTADVSMAWIDWKGDVPITHVFRDGARLERATVSDHTVGCPDGVTLTVNDSRVITNDHVGGLLAPLSALQSLMAPIARLHQTRWLSRGTLTQPGRPPVVGWVIHELVTWQ